MAKGSTGSTEGPVRTLFGEGRAGDRTDAQLLERFAAGGGEGAGVAFVVLVERHGPMVMRVCLAVLKDEHDAEDAFQATFLVLVRQTRSIRRRDSLASWLHGVALRVAASIRRRAEASRRREREGLVMAARPGRDGHDPDLGPVLHEEVGRLREPVVLCYFEGLTHDAAAERLGLPVGTVRSRLAAARDRLRVRLTRRGLATSAAPVDATLVPAAVPAALVDATVRLATGKAASATIVPIIEEVLKAMFLTRLAVVSSTLSAFGLAVSTAAWIGTGDEAVRGGPAREAPQVKPASPQAVPPADPLRDALLVAIRDAAGMTDRDAKAQALCRIGLALAQVGAMDEAREALRLARQAAEQMEFNDWQLFIRTEIAVARGGAREWDAALEDLKQLVQSAEKLDGINWRVRRWGEIAVAQVRLGDRDSALATLKRAREAIEGLDDRDEGLNAMIHLVKSLSTIGEYDAALDLIAAIPDPQSNLKDPLLREVAKVADLADRPTALRVLRRTAEIAATITYEVPKATTQMSLAPALARAGDVAGALRMARAIGKENVQFDDRDSIPWALAPIAIVQAESADRDGALATLREALEVAKGLQEGEIKAERLRRVAEAQAKVGDPDGAAATAELIGSRYEQSYAYMAIAKARARAGDRKAAGESFLRSVAAAEDAPQDHNRDWLLGEIVKAQAGAGDVPEAIATAKGHGDDSWKAGALTEVASIQARSGDVAGAMRTAESIRDEFYRPIVMKVIAAARARSGDFSGSLNWASQLDPAAKAQALAGLAQESSMRKDAEFKARNGDLMPGEP